MRIEDVRPVHVAGYIEQLQASRKAPTVKQHLACIRMLFDWLVTSRKSPTFVTRDEFLEYLETRGSRNTTSPGAI